MAEVDAALEEQVLDLAQRKQMYISAVRRITSGELLKYLQGLRIRRSYGSHPNHSSPVALTLRYQIDLV